MGRDTLSGVTNDRRDKTRAINLMHCVLVILYMETRARIPEADKNKGIMEEKSGRRSAQKRPARCLCIHPVYGPLSDL